MSKLHAIKNYYDRLAPEYDQDRFGGSYGQYLHRQEIEILENWLSGISPNDVLELGCGTGRFSGFAKTGVDFSEGMLSVARHNFPEHEFHEADIKDTGLPSAKFKAVVCLHVLMHLEKGILSEIWKEAHRLLQPNGLFIFDIPSARRRKLFRQNPKGWHGATSLFSKEVKDLNEGLFQKMKTEGVLFFPIHQLPNSMRNTFRSLDSVMGKTVFNQWSSYRFYCLRKI